MDSGAAAAVFMMSARLGLVSEMNFYNFFFFQPPAPRELVLAEQAPINWVFLYLYLYFHLYLDWYQIMACQQKYVFIASSFFKPAPREQASARYTGSSYKLCKPMCKGNSQKRHNEKYSHFI